MIQRVQSIWLFLAALTLICLLFLPLLTKNVNNKEYTLHTTGITPALKENDGSYSCVFPVGGIALNITTALLCFICIFQFKNRSRQKQLTRSAILLTIIMAGMYALNAQVFPGGITGASVKAGAFLPLPVILFLLLAIQGIRKDEQLLRSADRLR